ncbi:MAG: fructosamine kinase family protein [Bacteroidota bacterium]
MDAHWQQTIEQSMGKIARIRPLSDGDTSSIYQLELSNTTLVAKTNSATTSPGLLKAEHLGLTAIAAYQKIATPKIELYEQCEQRELLVMQHLSSGEKTTASLRQFGRQLAQLHQVQVNQMGWEFSNYIGKLSQSNQPCPTWHQFYAVERLHAQVQVAVEAGLLTVGDVPSMSRLEQACKNLLGDPQPSPLHGDLWSGNYIIDISGTGYLIDPSFYYGHSEVDLAMSRLFGGFGTHFYEAYHEVLPPEPGAAARRDLYQLYYLLVHLNMFGRSYLSSVQHILNRYF